MAECTPLGIGDLFYIRLIMDHYGLSYKPTINTGLLTRYRTSDQRLIDFTCTLVGKLFGSYNLVNTNQCNICRRFEGYKPKQDITLKKHFDLPPVDDDYIVIHTKMRFDHMYGNVTTQIAPMLKEFFDTWIPKSKVIVMGEQSFEEDKTTEVRAHNIRSLYEHMGVFLTRPNVIDKTVPYGIHLTPDYTSFLEDLRIIAGAKLVIGLGWGGNFALTWAVSDNFIFYVSTMPHNIINGIIKLNNPNKQLFRDLNAFLEAVQNN
jgi:hypothetical protein